MYHDLNSTEYFELLWCDNRVTYGLTAKVKIVFHDGQKEFIALKQLKDYVTNLTLESTQKALAIKEAVVYYPVPFCRDNNIEIIDTPGLGDSNDLTEITYSVLSQIDAAIFVMMALSPLSITELEFLTETLLTQDLGKVMFVITGIDLCPSTQAATKLISHIKQKLQKEILAYAQNTLKPNSPEYQAYLHKTRELKVFGISASMALQGRMIGDEELLEQSKIRVFETALRNFLEQEKGIVLLQNPSIKAITFCQLILENIAQKLQYYQDQEAVFAQTYHQAIAPLTAQETNYRQNLSSSALAEIARIHDKKAEKRAIWEIAKVKIEIKQKKLQKIATETQEILVEVENIAQYLRSLKLENSINITAEQICSHCGRANQPAQFCIYCGSQI